MKAWPTTGTVEQHSRDRETRIEHQASWPPWVVFLRGEQVARFATRKAARQYIRAKKGAVTQ